MARLPFIGLLGYLRRVSGPDEAAAPADARLLHRFLKSGDGDAFAALVERHGRMVLGVCRRVLDNPSDAEDAFQATFLILARKAASVRKRESLASWLHGVAHRTALRARAERARRRGPERQADEMAHEDPAAEAAWRELRPLLDEELGRLPEKYRAPIVLCYLEGKTNAEAARQLGWTKGTVSGRLARARDLLRGRLERRGLALPGAALAALLVKNGAAASVPAPLCLTTVQAAAAGAVPAPVAALVEGVLHTMFIAKWKVVGVLVLWVAALGAGAGIVARAASGDGPGAPAATEQKDKPQTEIEKLRQENERLRRELDEVRRRLEQALREAQAQRDVAEQQRRLAQEAAAVAAAAELEARARAEAALQALKAMGLVDSQNNLKHIGLALHHYLDKHKTFPAHAITDKQGKPLLSWRVAILPYLEGGAELYRQFRLDEPWDSAHNKKLLEKTPMAFQSGAKVGLTHFRGFVGNGAFFEGQAGLGPEQYPDGFSNTAAVFEAHDAVPWTKPDEMPYDAKKALPKLGVNPKDGFWVLFTDGSVRRVGANFDEPTLRRIITRADGEVVDPDKLR